MQANHEHSKPSNFAETIAEQWEAFAEFAGRLTREIAGMGRRGQRGFIKNVEILETWLRAALLQMAEQIALPAKRKGVRRAATGTASTHQTPAHARRPGFRAIDPDTIEQQLAALKRSNFDISQFSGLGGKASGQGSDARA